MEHASGVQPVRGRIIPAFKEEPMSSPESPLLGPDLSQGIDESALTEGGMLLGHIGEDVALLVRHGGEFFAIGATCTHYGGPLAECPFEN